MILLISALLPDTTVAITRAQPGWLWTVEGIIVLVLATVMVVLLGAYAFLAWKLKDAFGRIADILEKVRGDVKPVADRAAQIADHLEHAAASVDGAVSDVADTIRAANDTLKDAVATADERIRELDAIVQMARDEAEDLVVGAASTLRGVRGGIRAFRGVRRRGDGEELEDGAEERVPSPTRRTGGPRIQHEPAQDEE